MLLGGIQGTEVESGHVDVCWLALREVVVELVIWEGAGVEVDMVVVDDCRGLRRVSLVLRGMSR